MTKEQIYDDQIAPLMAQILAISKEHKIATFASFGLATAEDPDFECTSALLDPEYEPTAALTSCYRVYVPAPPIMLNTRDADGKLVNSTVVVG